MGIFDKLFRRDKRDEPATEERNLIVYSGEDTSLSWMYSGMATASGATVSISSVMSLDTVWAAVNLVSDLVGTLPLKVYRREENGIKTEARDHPAWRLLHRQPNEFMTPFAFKQTLMSHVLLAGNGYAWIERGNNGEPINLWILDPQNTYPIRANGRLIYVTADEKGGQIMLDSDDVLHVKNLGYTGLVGYNVIEVLAESFGGVIATREFGDVYFRNNGRPSIVIEFPEGRSLKTEEDVQRFKRSWESLHGGNKNAHRPAVLENGAKLSDVKINARDAQLIEKQKIDVRTIANIFKLPPHKLGDDSRTSFASIEAENKDTLDRLNSWLVNIEQECTTKLTTVREFETESVFCEFVRAALLQADIKTQHEVWAIDVNNGFLTLNEQRGMQNRPAFDIEEADIPRVSNNSQLIIQGRLDAAQEAEIEPEQLPPPEENEENSEKLEAALRKMFRDTATRMIARLSVHAERAARKPESYVDGIDTLAAKHKAAVRDAISGPLEAIHAYNGSTNAGHVRSKLIIDFCDEAVSAADCQPEDLAENVGTRLATFTAEVIPRYENLLFGSS